MMASVDPPPSRRSLPAAQGSQCMRTCEALLVLVQQRLPDEIVITHQGSAREWPKLSDHPLDLNYLPSAMGAAVPLGLGMAIAQAQREVTVILGDGSLLMNLGTLVTVTGARARNISVVLLDNGVYSVTGGQKTPASGSDVDFCGLAHASGFSVVAQFSDLVDWQREAPTLRARQGPRFVWLRVTPEAHELPSTALKPMSERLQRFRRAIESKAIGPIHRLVD